MAALGDNTMKIALRPFRQGDGEKILKLHRRAVNEIACENYDSEILNAWATPLTDDLIKIKGIEFNEKWKLGVFTIIAEIDGKMAGFGEVVTKQKLLLAVYINPDYKRMGVGKAILCELENIAKKNGATELLMDSSLTAEPFYKIHGYEIIDYGIHTLNSGAKMKCVKMKKKLAQQGDAPEPRDSKIN